MLGVDENHLEFAINACTPAPPQAQGNKQDLAPGQYLDKNTRVFGRPHSQNLSPKLREGSTVAGGTEEVDDCDDEYGHEDGLHDVDPAHRHDNYLY